MKITAIFLAILVLSSSLGESRASGLGGIYGQEQRNQRGKVIESIGNERMNSNNPQGSAESANHHVKPKEKANATLQENDGN